ncbi:nitrous oxide reductase family maturation protein NosD [Streptomyces shenzhenensis]|uniref:Right handed beta helix domain-containing protein n=1 Tax=Streptomyces shenzhenensis TaxID=943815 RepID=A0A3M0I603_9ACTN|nr:right-handed parallel beta-helix repeat-containing protein [Streptomyces shenzhenensis]RMB81559.1 hypothetical protein CTZ28_33580 [Streptomyces shenzhenensis]
MTKYHIASLACASALAGAALATTPACATAHAQTTHEVQPGQSIQKAVDAAQPGDTILLKSGIYRENVTVSTPKLTLRGTGQGTVIQPPAKKAASMCAEQGDGICVMGAKTRNVEGVTIADLTVTGFTRAGVFGMGTDGMTVNRVHAVKNGTWGIAQQQSVRGVFRENYAMDNGDAGLFLANTVTAEEGAQDTKGARVERNWLQNNRIGLTVRRLRNLTVANNDVTGNCVGMFVVGDENKPRAGALTVQGNRVTQNNKSCPKTERLPALQGSGIVLTGAEDSLVTRNQVTDHSGKSPLSGGIVLFKSFVGVTSERNRIHDNMLANNAPADLVNTDPGKGNTFSGNACRVSQPSGMC